MRVLIHPDHGRHELRCQTYGCPRAFQLHREGTHSQKMRCAAEHAVYCYDCRTWADLPARPTTKPAPPAPEPTTGQLPLF